MTAILTLLRMGEAGGGHAVWSVFCQSDVLLKLASHTQVARALGCEDDDDMEEENDDARGDADYGAQPRDDDEDDDEDDDGAGGRGNGTEDAGADTDAADPEGQHLHAYTSNACARPSIVTHIGL